MNKETNVTQRSKALEVLDFTQPPVLSFDTKSAAKQYVRLFPLEEINDEGHTAYRQALTNVYASLSAEQNVRLLYLIDSNTNGINLYFGVVAGELDKSGAFEGIKNLRGALEGQLPGINFGEDFVLKIDDIEQSSKNNFDEEAYKTKADELLKSFSNIKHCGVMLGAPTGPSSEQHGNSDQGFQGIDRIVRALQSGSPSDSEGGGKWQLILLGQPLSRKVIKQQLDAAYHLSSQLADLVTKSIQTSRNSSFQKSISLAGSETKGRNTGTSSTTGSSSSKAHGESGGTSSSTGKKRAQSGSQSGWSSSTTDGTNESFSASSGESYSSGLTETQSISDTAGDSLGITEEVTNKQAQHLSDYVDKQLIARLQRGLTKGLFHCSVYLAAETASVYQRLKNTARATFQGDETTLSPLEIYDLPKKTDNQLLDLPNVSEWVNPHSLLFHSLYCGQQQLGSLLTSDEIAIIANLPQREIQGVKRQKAVDFIVDLPLVKPETMIDIGEIIDRGRRYPNNRVNLSKKDLNKHTFITGVTGAGKTTTCLNLLLGTDMPFLVIEPAKTEYRELASRIEGVSYYRPNGDIHQSLRINPFALSRPDQKIKSHAGFLKNVFSAIFPMEASMPMMIEAAIFAAYKERGWDIDDNDFPDGDPFDPLNQAWPNMSDMIRQLDILLPTYKLGKELEEKYRGSLVSRLRSLTDGTLGRVLDVSQSIDFEKLLKRRVVIELEELQSGEEKALMMALILGCLNEVIRKIHQEHPDFRHLTLVEEAHRLLSRPEPGDKAAAMAVESFADMLAEVRKYGAGLIIADQIPAKLIPDVIKNTNVKIVHRLFAEDDRRTMGEAMMMEDEQTGFLPNLQDGEAVIFCGGWHGPAHVKVRHDRAQTDNQHSAFDSSAYGEKQLWQERQRYYPYLTQLPWFTDDMYQEFAEFARETRQAQNALLALTPKSSASEKRQLQAYKRLKHWEEKWWQPAQTSQSRYLEWQNSNCKWPKDLLAAAWLAMFMDANPKLKAGITAVSTSTIEDLEYLTEVSNSFIKLINEVADLKEWNASCKKVENADFRDYMQELTQYSSF